MIKFGVVLPQHEAGRRELLEAASIAERENLDSVWLSDVLWGRRDRKTPVLEGWASLAAVAASTSNIKVGTLVLRAPMRVPLLTARMFKTLDSIAPGRVIAGLGSGDRTSHDEFESFGIGFRPADARIDAVRITMEALRREAPAVNVWVGGSHRKLLHLARSADGWNFWGTVDQFVELSQAVTASSVVRSWAGSLPSEDKVAKLVEAGANYIIVAVGATNYERRIDGIISLRDKWKV